MAFPTAAAVAVALVAVAVILPWFVGLVRAWRFSIEHHHVFITGGSEGLGLALAKQYAAAGARVSIVSRSREKLSAAKASIEVDTHPKLCTSLHCPPWPLHQDVQRHSYPVFTMPCNVTDFDQVERAIHAANHYHERVSDLVICNAAISTPGYFLEQELSVVRQHMDVNHFGVVHTVRAAVTEMIQHPVAPKDSSRRIVIVNSGAGLLAYIGGSQYSSAKYATRGLAEALRNEFKLYDIGISVFYPGNLDTAMFENENLVKPKETRQIDGVSTPMSVDKAARILIRGVARGEYAITNEPLLLILRVIANGVAPRGNILLEMVFLPVGVLIQACFGLFMDAVVILSRRAGKRRVSEPTGTLLHGERVD